MLITEQGNIIEINEKLKKLFDLPTTEFVKKSILQLFRLKTSMTKSDSFELPLGRQIFSYLTSQQCKEIPVQLLFSNVNQDKLVTVIVTINQDEQLSNNTLDSLNQLSLTVEGANIGIWSYDINSHKMFFSTKFKQLINLTTPEESFTYQNLTSLVYEHDREVFSAFFKHHIHSEIPLDFEFRVLINKKIHWFRIKGNLFYQQQKKHKVMGTLIDISDRKSVLNKLNQVLISKEIAMEVGRVGSWHAILDHEHVWQWSWDELSNKLFGLQPEDRGNIEKWQQTLHPDDRENSVAILTHTLQTGEDLIQQYRAILPNGEIRYFANKGKVSFDNNRQICRIDGVCIDESAIRKVQNQLKKLNNELEASVEKRTKELKQSMEHAEHASQTKSDFLSMMSHELRTPMNAVIGSLDLLATTEHSVESMDLIDTAKTSSENLVCILNDILDISKIEAGKLLLEDRPFSLSEVIDNIVKVFVPTAQKQNIIFKVYEDTDIPMYVKGDSMRVRQILFNIIGNALKFTHTDRDKQGVVELHAKIIESNPYISTINFKVIDNGIGIDKDVQQKLFTPFTQAERSTTRNFGGTGLGLAICGQLTEMMGGRITLASEKGQGSCFEIELPFWLSQETNALDVELLSAINVCLVCLTTEIPSKQTVCEQNITASGAIVNKYYLSKMSADNEFMPCDFEVMVILVEQLSADKNQLTALIEQLNKNKQILIAVRTLDIPLAKTLLKGVRIINLETLTKIQLINLIKQTKENNCKFNFEDLSLELDELVLDGLDYDIEKEQKQRVSQLKADILVVEDNPLNQILMKQQLAKLGYGCDLAGNGEEGKKVWQTGCYKMILTDCHMPKMDGYQMTQNIRSLEQAENKRQIPIIAVTGAAMSGDDEKCFQAGMSDFVSKPVQLADLRKVLKKWYAHG